MKTWSAILAAACMGAALWSAPAAAQFAKPDDAIEYRQSAFELIASHFGRMRPVVTGQAPFDAAQIQANVKILQTLTALPWAAFGEGTQGGDAKEEIWANLDDFRQKQQALADNVAKLAEAADSGDLGRVRDAYGNVGSSCKACHDAYREK